MHSKAVSKTEKTFSIFLCNLTTRKTGLPSLPHQIRCSDLRSKDIDNAFGSRDLAQHLFVRTYFKLVSVRGLYSVMLDGIWSTPGPIPFPSFSISMRRIAC